MTALPATADPSDSRAVCPVCDSSEKALRYRITLFRVYDCRACQQVYLWPLLTEDEVRSIFSQLYTEGEGSVPELKTYYEYTFEDEPNNPLVQQYEAWLDGIERHTKRGRLLDIGCGTGLFLAVARRRGWEPFGIDECAEATTHAREHFGLDVWDGEFSQVAADGQTYDAISMWDIIEHARKPVELLQAAKGVLAPGGAIGISTPCIPTSILEIVGGAMYHLTGGRLTRQLEKFYIEQHFLYFVPETMKGALERAGLRSLELAREQTDLRRLDLNPAARLVLELIFAVGRLTGRENRIFTVAGHR